MPKSSRAFCGAEFGDIVVNGIEDAVERGDVRYYCDSPETCPSTGREHHQFFVYFKHEKTITAAMKYLKKHLGFTSPVQICKGTPAQNRVYCGAEDYVCERTGKTKAANPAFEEYGALPVKGKRVDLDKLKNRILGGERVDDICLENPQAVHQYGRTLDRLEDIRLRSVKRTKMTQGIWIVGPTNVGKSHMAYDLAGEDCYTWCNDRGWQDGYTGQKAVVINDFRGNIPFNELLQMVDKWPYSVRRRGRPPMPFTSELVIITTPPSHHPKNCYHNLCDGDSVAQLLRRFDVRELRLGGQGNPGPDLCGDDASSDVVVDCATPAHPWGDLSRSGKGSPELTNNAKINGGLG